MEKALAAAGLGPSDIDYINLHGTATKVGDAAEDHAIAQLFGRSTQCNSTKGLTGHTLGASGIVEAIVSMAHSLGMRVVAEGVETEDQRRNSIRMGCDAIQGFLHSKPVGAHMVPGLIGWTNGVHR